MPSFSKFALGGLTTSLSLLAMSGPIAATEDGEDKAAEFKNMAREDVGRLQNPDAQGETGELEDSLNLKSSGNGFNAPNYIGAPGPSIRLEEENDKEKEEEEEKKRNWLLDSVRKLSGEQELTDEEKEKLKNLSGDLNLVDRYVANRLQEQVEKEEAEEKIKMTKKESFDEDGDEASTSNASTDYRPEIPGLANSVPKDPLKALEKKYMADALGETPAPLNSNDAEANTGNKAKNPYLEPIEPSDFQFNEFSLFNSSTDLAQPQKSIQSNNTPAKINAPANPGSGLSLTSVLTENISFPMIQAANNPYFATTILQDPTVPSLNTPQGAAPILPSITNGQGSLLPTLKPIPTAPGNANGEPSQPNRPLDENEKKYFPRLNRF